MTHDEIKVLESARKSLRHAIDAIETVDELLLSIAYPLIPAPKDDDIVTRAPTPKPAPGKSGFKFGAGSEKELIGVKPELVNVVRLALDLSTQDFLVFDGLRTVEEQRRHVANGTSKTMKSKHLDGLAVDLVPYIDGKPKWDWDGCYDIAFAMMVAADKLGCADRITWGGAWDRRLSDFVGKIGTDKGFAAAVQDYQKRHPGPDFIDGPHFQWEN